MFVSIPDAPIREKRSNFSNVSDRAKYGEMVEIVSEIKSWRFVKRRNGKNGWIPLSALSSHPILNVDSSVDSSELSFAGKNFSTEDESAYRTSGNVNYDAVDAMEKSSVSEAELRTFLSEGNLKVE